ncbi:MAG TPA: inositol monophosphatase family protein, partial [Puia sp.]|nr:inositol monophosphatase family protein [Puia sp.]
MLKSTLIRAAEAGAAVMQRYFQGEFKISNKEGINNLVTEADHASEKAIFDVIREDYPDHYLLSEEAGEISMDSSYKWIIDPIDGTVNFAHGLPLCCVSVAVEQAGEMIL